MRTQIRLNGSEIILIALIAVVGQWSTGQNVTWSFLVPSCFLIIIIWLGLIGKRIFNKFGKIKWDVIGLGILALFPFNFLGLLAEVLTLIPINGEIILFLNTRFKLVIGMGILLFVALWLLLAIRLASFWQTTVKLQVGQLLKNIGLYLCWLVGLTGSLLLIAGILKTQWLTAGLNGILILGLTIGQLWFLIRVWSGGNSIQIIQRPQINFIGLALIIGVGAILTNGMLTSQSQQIVAHRGVYRKAQIPNSISALAQTSRQKFNFVEMDVRETKDHYFICQHDDELKLGGNRAKPVEDLTLRQIQQHHKVTLFKDYIAVANQKQQRLIVEIKPGGSNTQLAGRDFIHQFKTQLIQNDGMVHSMELSYLQQIKRVTSKVPVGLVTTINTGNLMNKSVDFYSMQAFSLNPALIQQAYQNNRSIYIWTVRRSIQSLILATLPITGQITDIGGVVRQSETADNLKKIMFLVATAWNYL